MTWFRRVVNCPNVTASANTGEIGMTDQSDLRVTPFSTH